MHPHDPPDPGVDPVQHWEDRYAADDHAIWSGRPNAALVSVVGDLIPGRAVDLGCGEGGDAIWLAGRGWQVTGVDLSPTAVGRARRAAQAAGIPDDRITWLVGDLDSPDDAVWGNEDVDLVAASFLHSRARFDRTAALRRATGLVAPGGHLVIVSHAAVPPWSSQHGPGPDGGHRHDRGPDDAPEHGHGFLTPEQEVAALALPPGEWTTVLAETRTRETTGPDGAPTTLDDVVVLLRRHPA